MTVDEMARWLCSSERPWPAPHWDTARAEADRLLSMLASKHDDMRTSELAGTVTRTPSTEQPVMLTRWHDGEHRGLSWLRSELANSRVTQKAGRLPQIQDAEHVNQRTGNEARP